MELRHIRYFMTVALELNFSRAAKRLHISQPPLSQQIRQLEEELGIELFDRRNRQIKLTEAGRIFLKETESVLAQLDRAVDLAQRANRGEVGDLRVAFHLQYRMIVLECFRLFVKDHPKVHVTSFELRANEAIMAVQDNRADVAFVNSSTDDPSLVTIPILRDQLAVLMSDRHPLAARTRIPLRALKGERCIMRPRHLEPLHDLVLSEFHKAGVAIDILYEYSSVYTILALVAAGLAIMIMPFSALGELQINHVVLRKLQPPSLYLDARVAYRIDDRSPLLKEFLKVLTRVARRLPHNRTDHHLAGFRFCRSLI